MTNKRIIISVTNDLVTDQRVHRVAQTLYKEGYVVMLVGRLLKNSQPVHRSYKTKRFRLLFNTGPLFYACYNLRLFLFLMFVKADIFLSNDLDTLMANFRAAKLRNKILVYDSHEYYTEVPELTNRPKVKKYWEKIERKRLPKIKHAYTVCNSLAKIYQEKYKIEMKVVRNVPYYKDKPEKKEHHPKIIIYQGALNVDRGLEQMIKAMQYINNAEFHIYGDGDITEDLKRMVMDLELTEKVKFMGRKKLEELHQYTSQADLGISLEQKNGLNYYYALPNKLFDYVQARIPVLCSDFPEMKKIITQYNIGQTTSDFEPKKLADKTKEMLDANYKQENFEHAARDLCWENEKGIILQWYNDIT